VKEGRKEVKKVKEGKKVKDESEGNEARKEV
jgi:hypothetical protein